MESIQGVNRLFCALLIMVFIITYGALSADGEIVFTDSEVLVNTEPLNGYEETEIVISAVGDVTFGANMKDNPRNTFYSQLIKTADGNLSYFFENVQEYFSQDDLTIVNFEGTLTNSTKSNRNNPYCFRAPPEHVQILTLGSVEAVSFENNHVNDFGDDGYRDTISAFESVGIVYSTEEHMGVYEINGITIAMLAYNTIDNYERLFPKVPLDIASAKEKFDVVIVSFHWGFEKDFSPRENQIKMGRLAIDSGADLVLGHHSHRINPIENYKGKYIVYSLANFSFSGNTRPDNMDTFILQVKFTFNGESIVDSKFRIIPCSISSITADSGEVSGKNDLAPSPFDANSEAAQRVISRLITEGGDLEYAVDYYPTEWE